MAEFNIFGPPSKDSVRVGYISTDRGYIEGVTICDANKHAQKNPGTQFIFKTRNFIKYLNINEVNKLTPDDALVGEKTCEGVVIEKQCGPAEVFFYGGGGVGVQGNPIIGSDGSVLAVDLVAGGFGYQYPPIVEVKDSCGIGAGAVVTAVLGEVVETVEVYDQEGDFEDYNFDLCPPEAAGYGLRYGPGGEVLGKWDPTLYANLSRDPIRKEIKEYQDFLQQLQKPWWTTRKEPPLRVTSANRTTRIKHDVTFPAWSDFLNQFAISPVPPSNAPGSDFAGQEFQMEWEEEFPYDGEYVFRAQADNIGRFYLDNEKLIETVEFRKDQTPKLAKKTVTAGVHRIRIDLYNEPQYEVITTQPSPPPPPPPPQQPFNLKTEYTGVRDVPVAFKAGIYKIYVEYKQATGPTGLAIEIKNKANGGVVFNSLQSINGANIKLIPVSSGKIDLKEFTKNSQESKDFLKRSGVFPENVKNNSTTNIEWTNVQLNEDGDYLISVSVDDSVDMTISLVNALSTAAPPPPPAPKSQSSTQTDETQVRKIFNTVDYIDKADRKLWRLDPRAGRDAGFINQFGILPFDPNSTEAQTESFAGTHVIRWETIDFPIDGNYNIEVMVDDDVTLYIGNREGAGRVEIGNGLRDINEGGDEVIIKKIGYSSPGKSTGKSLETRFFKAGKYRIRAELAQINVGPLAKGNPMALAVNIEVSFTQKKVISARSWNENPMGATLTIDAPLPPIPQEPIPLQEGRCPRNPMWTTRFPNGSEKWWPVNYTNPKGESWSAFTNRFAISPVPPLSTPGSDSGGVVYRNSWNVDFPYDGFYALKATVDNAGRILIDNKPVMQANYIPTELRNTRGGSGRERRSGIDAIDGGVIFNWRENNPKAKKIFITKGLHKIEVEVENGITETFKKIDQKVFSTNDWIASSPPKPQSADIDFDVFVGGQIGKTLRIDELNIVLGKKFTPLAADNTVPYEAYREKFTRKVEYEKVYTVRVTDFDFKYYNPPGKIQLKSTGSSLLLEDWIENRFDDCVINASTGKFFDIKGDTCKFVVNAPAVFTSGGTSKKGVVYEGPTPIASYPQPITGRTGFISPLFQDVNAVPNEEIQGRTWIFRWSNVDFPVSGQYTLEAEADDNVVVKIDGVQVGGAKLNGGRPKTKFNATAGKRTVELELSNIRVPDTGFYSTPRGNPVLTFVEITVPVDTATGVSKPWTQNPMGISAILIPPPCPKVIKGKGVVTRVDIDDPGTSYPPPTPSSPPIPPTPTPAPSTYPVALRLSSVPVLDTGINHNCGVDKIQITPSNGAVLDYDCDSFGRIKSVKVLNPGFGFTRYPNVRMITDTGINATFAPQFEVVRDPIVVDPQKLIQVTDLAGLKQTGYVDGRAYYGAVFLKDGLLFAGFYETPGELVQVYATLKESIDAQVTTRPSAIQRQGTDITSNDPRLNIPGTPDQII